MMSNQRMPFAGMALLALACFGLAVARVPWFASVLIVLTWLLSLWIDRWRPTVEEEPITILSKPDLAAIARDAMRAAIEPVGVPLLLTDSGRILAANAAARASLGAHVVGQDARIALRHPEAVRLLERGDGATTVVPGLIGNGSLWQLTRSTLPGSHWLIELRDRSAEADLSRAHTDFVANASHELRTPLASIIGYVETLADAPGGYDAPTVKRFLGIVLREARRMDSLVSDLMSLSQLEAGKHDVPTERLDLGGLAQRVVSEFGKNARIRVSRPDEDIPITGDLRELEQLVRNLIDNALKYGDDDKPVEIEVRPADPTGRGAPMPRITVTDHGPGIAPEHLPYLTRRFYRTDPGRSRAAGGTGLGLAIVKHIVERHRGKLDIASELGVGTNVTIRLPSARGGSPENPA